MSQCISVYDLEGGLMQNKTCFSVVQVYSKFSKLRQANYCMLIYCNFVKSDYAQDNSDAPPRFWG